MKKLTVTIFTYNRAESLKKCIECILNSTYKEFFLVILDNASIDDTRDIVNAFQDDRIVYINNGINIFRETYQKAFRICATQYFYPICDDDYIEPNAIEEMMNIFDKYPEMNVVGSNYIEINEVGNLVDGGHVINSVLEDTYYDKYNYLEQEKFLRFSTTIYDMNFINDKHVKLNQRGHDALFADNVSVVGAYMYRLSDPLVKITHTSSVQHMRDRYERDEWIIAIETLKNISLQLESLSEDELAENRKDIIRRKLQARYDFYYAYLLEVDFNNPNLILSDYNLSKNISGLTSGKLYHEKLQDERLKVYFELLNDISLDKIKKEFGNEIGEYYRSWQRILNSSMNISTNMKKYKYIAIWGIRFNSKLLNVLFRNLGIKIRYIFDNQAMDEQIIDGIEVMKPIETILDDIDLIILGNEGIKSISRISEDLINMNYRGKIISWRDMV